ncbi:MAG TPA: D-glycero-beta-D-manno-heptose 1-phosphate adenylyltransferase [Candidatus Marinimicrobia bacterium]|nr:D-glycero-beta-D-manno-heptose 1-phosphate adenylyltransferase [Candidatus Neomarinimicrobiota bacterium]HRS51672.1 D-glycero-beta-D-manno-heptose 1-phosphate adenylyltransferase [Candidatus Neomarinimicrobiota bacterium]HRU92178.1 D-glycero-beta-D-manno-heptose 1-phosphate adenylyltransferase [Candidatus Neomarinimicrobiota bacterium]
MPKNEKIITREQACRIVSQLKKEGRKIVFTNGCFDILHVGHLELLENARKLGDILIVGLNSDDSVQRLKGTQRPINTQLDRARVLAALAVVDYVIIFDEDTPLELIQALQPDFLVKGGDYSPDTIVGSAFVKSYGGQVVVFPLVHGKSTSELIKTIFQL